MKTLLKGILLYTTIFSYILFVGGIDGITKEKFLLESILIIIFLTGLCKILLTEKDILYLTFNTRKDIDEEDEQF